jgi:hypothetical protein
MPHVMILLVRTYGSLGPYMPAKFEVLPCCNFHLPTSPAYSLSCRPFAGMFWGCVIPATGYQAQLLDELGLQPLHIIWLKACVKFTTFCTTSRGDSLLWEAMRAHVEPS